MSSELALFIDQAPGMVSDYIEQLTLSPQQILAHSAGVFGSVGMRWEAECCDQSMAASDRGELFEVQSGSLLQVRYSFLDALSLRRGASFGVKGDVGAFFRGCNDCGEFHERYSVKVPEPIVADEAGCEA